MVHRKATHLLHVKKCRDFMKGDCQRSDQDCYCQHIISNETDCNSNETIKQESTSFVCKKEFQKKDEIHKHKKT